jgi:predicted CoA-binding protein
VFPSAPPSVAAFARRAYTGPMEEQQGDIDRILSTMKNVAVVGISADPSRPSNEVAGYLIRQGFNVFLVNPLIERLFDRPVYPDLASVPAPVEVVDVFRKPEDAGAVVDQAIAVGAKAVWMQEGVVDEAAAARARAAGLTVVMNRCMLKEHARAASGPVSD